MMGRAASHVVALGIALLCYWQPGRVVETWVVLSWRFGSPSGYGTPLAQQVDKLREYHATHLLESIRLH